MPLQPLKPGDIPRPMTSAERRRLAQLEADDRVRVESSRPNEPFTDTDRCPQSKYQQHRFVLSGNRTICEFCGKPERLHD